MPNQGNESSSGDTWRSVGEGHVAAAERWSSNTEGVVEALLAIYCELRHQDAGGNQSKAMKQLSQSLRVHASAMEEFGPGSRGGR